MNKISIPSILGILVLLYPPFTFSLSAQSSEEILIAYKNLRTARLDSTKVIVVTDLLIQKDVGEFHLEKGKIYFHKPVMNRVTGAVFIGDGNFRLSPPDNIQKKGLSKIEEGKVLEIDFKELNLFFSDQTYAEVLEQFSPGTDEIDPKAIKSLREQRKDLKEDFGWNIPARIMADLVSEKPEHFFIAFFKERDRYFFNIEPREFEEVTLRTYKIHRSNRPERVDFVEIETYYSASAADPEIRYNRITDTKEYTLNVILEENQKLHGIARVEYTSLIEGDKMLLMNLSPELRVENVLLGETECSFIQEDEEEDADFWILLPECLREGITDTLTITYSGEGIVEDAGGGNYYVGNRTNWYPNFEVFTDKALYRINYRVPKGKTILSTGKLVEQSEDDFGSHTSWDSEVPITVAGFNYGRFDVASQKDSLIVVDCYTNRAVQDRLYPLQELLENSSELRAALMLHSKDLTTEKMTKDAAVQGYNSYNIFTHYFGEIPFKKMNISQQPFGSFGQSWPTLVYFPFTALLKPSVRLRLGLTSDFFETVVAHEVAHQWWGHVVSPTTYHDEWLNEGFSEYSAALYTQQVEGNEEFIEFMNNRKDEILKKIKGSGILNDVGPVWWGSGLDTIDGRDNSDLVYCKGAYVLHMLRMMLYDYRTNSDDRFIRMMKDYVSEHTSRNATTASFQVVVEKHFGQDMDWFFDQWVYGTKIPSYEYEYSASPSEDGKYILTISVTQKDVPYDFKMPFPFVINFEKGYSVIVVETVGTFPVTREVKIPGLPKSIVPNPWESVLAVEVKSKNGN